MVFGLGEERKLLQASQREFAAKELPPARLRRSFDAGRGAEALRKCQPLDADVFVVGSAGGGRCVVERGAKGLPRDLRPESSRRGNLA
jgi:hypothetical protein